jgi:hypothetical protein
VRVKRGVNVDKAAIKALTVGLGDKGGKEFTHNFNGRIAAKCCPQL